MAAALSPDPQRTVPRPFYAFEFNQTIVFLKSSQTTVLLFLLHTNTLSEVNRSGLTLARCVVGVGDARKWRSVKKRRSEIRLERVLQDARYPDPRSFPSFVSVGATIIADWGHSSDLGIL